jgi:DNA-binding NarL/FixJ family response regulator
MKNGNSNGLNAPAAERADRPYRVALAARRRLDLGGVSRLICESEMLTLVAAELELEKAAEACANLTPDVAMFDAAFPEGGAFDVAEELLARRKVRAVIFLDDEFAMARAQRAVAIPHTAYFTRHDEFTYICGGIGELLAPANIDAPKESESHCPAPKFLLDAARLRELNCDGFLCLSAKERQIMRYLARGHTVPETAQMLSIARSTVDNHKSRLMKKLNICHMTQITRVAMRVGLID